MKFKHTKKALKEYDKLKQIHQDAWINVKTNKDVEKVQIMERQQLDAVRLAFFEDTKGINCLDHMRKCVEGDK